MKPARRLLCCLLSMAMIIATVTVQVGAQLSDYVEYDGIIYPVVEITLDGEKVFEKEALLVGNVTMVPLRAICNTFGHGEGAVNWYPSTRTGEYISNILTITATCDDNYIEANGRILYNEEPVRIINDTMYVPIRSIANAFNSEITWYGETRSADFHLLGGVIEPGSTFYNQSDLLWLARLINAECRYEPLLGRVAVANVVLNRVKSPSFPNSVYSVIFDNRYGIVQFYPADSPYMWVTPVESSYIAAKIALEGVSVNDDIIYYLNPAIVKSCWITMYCKYELKIGNHSFYS